MCCSAPLLGLFHALGVAGGFPEQRYLLAEDLGCGAILLGVVEAMEGHWEEGMVGVDEVDVGFTTITIDNWYLNSSCSITSIFDHFNSRTRVREPACHDLNFNYSKRKTVDLLGVDGRISDGLRWHVDQGPWARSVGCHAWVDTEELRHTEVGDFGPATSDKQDIVTGEVAMDDIIGVEVIQSQGYVVAQGDLDMVGQRLMGSFEKMGEAFVHEFHQ